MSIIFELRYCDGIQVLDYDDYVRITIKFLAAQVTRALLAEGLADELQGDKKNVLVGGHSSLVPTMVW